MSTSNTSEQSLVKNAPRWLAVSIPTLVTLGVFYSSGQEAVVGEPFLRSHTYTDTLFQAFEPLRQLVFFIVVILVGCLIGLLALIVLLVSKSFVELIIFKHIIYPWKRRKAAKVYDDIMDSIEVSTVSQAFSPIPSQQQLHLLETRYIHAKIGKKLDAKVKLANERHLKSLADLARLKINNPDNSKEDTHIFLRSWEWFKQNRFSHQWVEKQSLFVCVGAATAAALLYLRTGTVYLSWLSISATYLLFVAFFAIAKRTGDRTKRPDNVSMNISYGISFLSICVFMFLLGRDTVQSKAATGPMYHIVGSATELTCVRLVASNSQTVIILSRGDYIHVPWNALTRIDRISSDNICTEETRP